MKEARESAKYVRDAMGNSRGPKHHDYNAGHFLSQCPSSAGKTHNKRSCSPFRSSYRGGSFSKKTYHEQKTPQQMMTDLFQGQIQCENPVQIAAEIVRLFSIWCK